MFLDPKWKKNLNIRKQQMNSKHGSMFLSSLQTEVLSGVGAGCPVTFWSHSSLMSSKTKPYMFSIATILTAVSYRCFGWQSLEKEMPT